MCTDPDTFTLPAAQLARYRDHPDELRYLEKLLSEGKKLARTARQVYESGAPWWTKGAIRDLGRQLERIQQSGDGVYEVTVTDLLGTPKKLTVSTGTFHPDYPVHWKEGERKAVPYVIILNLGCTPIERRLTLFGHRRQPCIDYVDYQKLGFIHHPFDLDLTPSTLNVVQWVEQVDLTTGEVIPPFPLYSLDELRRRFLGGKASFEASKLCKDIIWAFENSFGTIPLVRKIIIFAAGTPSRKVQLDENGRNEHDESSVTHTEDVDENGTEIVASIVQLSLAVIMRDFIQTRQEASGFSGKIKCYAQEPQFTENDKTVLGEHGVSVLDDPHGFLEMDDETAVISFNANVPVRSITAELARPAIMIWNACHEDRPLSPASLENFRVSHSSDKDNEDQKSGVDIDVDEVDMGPEYCTLWTDPVTPRLVKMVEDEYWYADFPDGPGFYPGFGPNPAIYVRKQPPKLEPKKRAIQRDGPLLANFSRPF
ncbi:hypothetical protein V8F20_006825 [Naviculisporaceae sp. PSN 640]